MRINAVQLEAPYAGIVHIRFYVFYLLLHCEKRIPHLEFCLTATSMDIDTLLSLSS
jgi:hypothetical protein